jgi:hypothetical protein
VAISWIGGTSGNAQNAGAVTLTLPGSMAVDDLILIAYSCGDDDFTQPTLSMSTAGYTELTTSTLSVDGGANADGNLAVFYKFHNGSDTQAISNVSGTGTDSSNALALQVFRGVATVAQGGPLEIAIATATNTTPAGDPDPPSVSGFDQATAVVVIAGATGGATTPTLTAPTNYTTNAVLDAHTTETVRAGVGLAYREDPADPEDPGAFTSSAAGAWAAATMVLKEAPAVVDVQFDVHYANRSIYPGPTS